VGVESDTPMRTPESSIELQSSVSPEPRYSPDGKTGGLTTSPRARITVDEIAGRLDIGRVAVYTMLEQSIIPAIRLGRRWIITRRAFENWERTCGMPTGLQWETEHKVT
jgi:excisionase family DNA binding protein